MNVTVAVCDCIGIALMMMVLFTNRGLFFRDRKMKYLVRLSLVTIASCVADMMAFSLDGTQGTAALVLIYIVNSWLFLSVILIAYFWLKLLCERIGVQLNAWGKTSIMLVDIVGAVILVPNLFFPLVFSVKDNVYSRRELFWIYVAIGALNILYGLVMYFWTCRRGGMLVSFSVGVLVVPIVTGIVVQSLFYGVSVVWVGVAVSIVGMISSMKNELIYVDQLTGVYNRYYLEKLKKDVIEYNLGITGIMADLNDFKSINDRLGHKTGDEALVETANILTASVEGRGKIIRYAGDEFIIAVNSVDRDVTESIIAGINQGFERFNASNSKDYRLSAAMGFHVFNMKEQTIDEFMNTLDMKMYENKQKCKKARE